MRRRKEADGSRRGCGVCVTTRRPKRTRSVLCILGFILIIGRVPSTQNGVAGIRRVAFEQITAVNNYRSTFTVPLEQVTAVNSSRFTLSSLALSPDDAVKLRYLSLVYNEDVRNVSLFDELQVIYRNSSVALPLHMIPCIVFVNGWDCIIYWKRYCLYGRKTVGQDQILLAEANWPTKSYVVGDHEWAEVTHWGLPEGSGYGCFFNVRKGTGVFINVQKSLVVKDDEDAKSVFKRLLNVTSYAKPAEFCPHARKLGYDSVQITNWVERLSKGRSGTHQVIYCRGSCETEAVESSCVPGIEFRTGVHHDKPCRCDESLPVLNCGNEIAPRGAQHLCDQVQWRDLSVNGTGEFKAGSVLTQGSGKVQAKGNLIRPN